jgi:alpha-tubulin suppressor-like RCC1 family protein
MAQSSLDAMVPTMVPNVSMATTVSSGARHTCALRSNGTVQCWGFNLNGECGNGGGSGLYALPSVVAGVSNVTGIATGTSRTCAVDTDHEVSCWGSGFNAMGIGGGSTSTPIKIARSQTWPASRMAHHALFA